MRIAMFGQKNIPSRQGGVEVAVGELSGWMVRKGHKVTCYNRGGKDGVWKGVRLKSVPVLGRIGPGAVSSSFFAALCSAVSNAEVVHIHAEGPAFWCWIPKLLGKRVVVTIHGLDWQREKWKKSFGKHYLRMGEKMAASFADTIIVLSRNMQDYFRKTYGRDTVWIPNGISEQASQEANKITRQFGLTKDSYLLFLGRLVPEKGIHYLIEAFREIPTEKKLVIAGAASDTDDYVARLHTIAAGDGRILFTGFVDGTIREELYSNAWIYVLPSDLEGMPLSLLEAMCYGNCCLTSDIPECTEVTGTAAAQFPAGEIAQLRSLLTRLCEEPETVARFREEAKQAIRLKDDWEQVTEKTLEHYR